MSFVVTKAPSVVVRPSEPVTTAAESIKLSSYDKIAGASGPPTILLVFEHPIDEPAETIKRCLSQALVQYYPLAGRLAPGATLGETVIILRTTGEEEEGVPFVAASADCAVKELLRPIDACKPLLDDLAMYYPGGRCGPADPLLMMQVTDFSCGGFVAGVTWNHAIADGAGMGQFLQAVGELARGLSSPSVIPVRHWDDDTPLACIPPSNIYDMMLAARGIQAFDMATLDVTIPSRIINNIKARSAAAATSNDGRRPRPCSVFQAAMAVLWQCRTRAIMSDPGAPSALRFTANARSFVGGKAGYYGNCATAQLVMASSGAVANGDVMDVVRMIQHAMDQIPEQFSDEGDVMNTVKMIQRAKDAGNTLMDADYRFSSGNIGQLGALLGYNFCSVTSSRNLGLEEADFGAGKPARVIPYMQHEVRSPFCVLCPPCQGVDGCNVLSLCVKQEHVDAFLGELARFA
ncbi:acyl transferase 15 [Brachypodium distachyon]|uniref:Uncharacterized protein n=1 Tax=Brachypodium distachyon TaxID=15368 RepID=I1IMF9_BRADI|nr:acyl transferase 15 [Brachypodium distachyon]KQJ88885.1 hypothetical protein BRADI_4g21920v3 [Brachypodium distachyon]|eukprot:XP_024318784.1 acyl transferase 15 [Brachypodium distachyon]